MEVGFGVPRHKFTAEEVMAMVRTGILGEEDRVELLEGDLYPMSPQDFRHSYAVTRLSRRLFSAYLTGFVITVQQPLLLSRTSLPEPDFAVLRGEETDFSRRYPSAADCVLVIEVAWSSQRRDREKAALYAQAGVPVYWILDLEARRLEVYEQPAPNGIYRERRSYDEPQAVTLPSVDATIAIAELLPPRDPAT